MDNKLLDAVKEAEEECKKFLLCYTRDSKLDVMEQGLQPVFKAFAKVLHVDPKVEKAIEESKAKGNPDPHMRVLGVLNNGTGAHVGVSDMGHFVYSAPPPFPGHMPMTMLLSLETMVNGLHINPVDFITDAMKALSLAEMSAISTQRAANA